MLFPRFLLLILWLLICVRIDVMLDEKMMIERIIHLSGLYFTPDEIKHLEVTDFGLNDFKHKGLTIHTYVNTSRCCAKELILLPYQLCPEHEHPTIGTILGKEETFRCRFGKISVFVQGEPTLNPSVDLPEDKENYTVFHEVVLTPGDQFTLTPNSKHWFKAHDEGAVVSEFSTHSNDDTDIFTNKSIQRSHFLNV